ncbi:MAG TPA: Hsp70 family protein, partial [Terrimicrobiaceae bacterium]
MSQARFSIGIDLGTTNCAMAYVPLDGEASKSDVFPIAQWETATALSESATLPSFLYFPTESEAAQIIRSAPADREWIAGRFARKQASESPGRVAHSAKSWLCHHSVDRNAPFLPWRSDELPVEKRISPIQASALLLRYLRNAWDARFAPNGAQFLDQEITITVPASFDAVAQGLTLDAANLAGFSNHVRLLEEPQAAFYRWLEEHSAADVLKPLATGSVHVLVIDIGGGTSDFSLFEIRQEGNSPLPHIKRLAVSDHLLLGGDNIDLALAHNIEPRFGNESLSPSQWNFLVARCRDLKERCLTGAGEEQNFVVSVPSQGSSLFAKTLTARIERHEVESIVLEGFFPECTLDELPARAQAGLREWALPYAADSAVTRYLADFLRDRPKVDAILFNGGSLHPEALRNRLQRQVAAWQPGTELQVLENSEPDLAVARGAARFGSLVHHHAERIEAGAARAIYLEVHRQVEGEAQTALVCLLPRNAAAEDEFKVAAPGLELRLNQPVRFQAYYSTRHDSDIPGSLVALNDRDFHRLPPLQTTAKVQDKVKTGSDRLPVTLRAKMSELGLLKVACVSADPKVKQSWPLEFNLRPPDPGEEEGGQALSRVPLGVDETQLESARTRISSLFSRSLDKRDKISAANLLKNLEQILKMPKAEWNSVLIRELWSTLFKEVEHRKSSIEHEETWLILAGFF